jgi:hypothetical protein
MGKELYSKVPNKIKHSVGFSAFKKTLNLFIETFFLYDKWIC